MDVFSNEFHPQLERIATVQAASRFSPVGSGTTPKNHKLVKLSGRTPMKYNAQKPLLSAPPFVRRFYLFIIIIIHVTYY